MNAVHVLSHTIVDTRRIVGAARAAGQSVGFVPTMGALHSGHEELIHRCRAECGFVAVSIFVNPTQFGPNEDYTRYPRSLPEDYAACERAGADLVFAPDAAEMYPPGGRTTVEVADLGEHLCGASRPGHFRGVATVVLKLLNIIQPDRAYFGRKDAQQARIVQQMVRDLDVPSSIVVVPTVRDPDGLAMSSRNRYLDAADRQRATVLIQTLRHVRQLVEAGHRDAVALQRLMAKCIAATPGAELDYAAIVDADTLQPIARLDRPGIAALAVRFGATRLIDNIELAAEPS